MRALPKLSCCHPPTLCIQRVQPFRSCLRAYHIILRIIIQSLNSMILTKSVQNPHNVLHTVQHVLSRKAFATVQAAFPLLLTK